MGRRKWAEQAPYGGRYEAARERVCERGSNSRGMGSLAGHIEQCPCRESRGSGILRPVLRAIFQLVLHPFLRAALRNRGFRGVERAGKGAQDTAWSWLRRWASAASRTFVTTEWWTPALSAITFFRDSVSASESIRATTATG